MKTLEQCLQDGELNDFFYTMLDGSAERLDLHCWSKLFEDALEATTLGVSDVNAYKLYHYADRFCQSVAKKILGHKISKEECLSFKKHILSICDSVDFSNLANFYIAFVDWANGDFEKKAYPNNAYRPKAMPTINLSNWARIAAVVSENIRRGYTEDFALDRIKEYVGDKHWKDFTMWYRFKFGKFKDMYDVGDLIIETSEGTMDYKKSHLTTLSYIHEDERNYYLPEIVPNLDYAQDTYTPSIDKVEKELKYKDHNDARSKLVSRTFAIDRLLEKYHSILGDAAVSEIEDSLNTLRKKIRSLKMATIIADTIHKTANVLRKKGFLLGAEYLVTEANKIAPGHLEKYAFDAKSPELAKITEKLQQLSNETKRRDLVREIARVDLALHEMNAFAIFPELAEAQAKLIDATTYAINKMDDVLGKLRSLQIGAPLEQVIPTVTPPTIEPNTSIPVPPAAPAADTAKPPAPKPAPPKEPAVQNEQVNQTSRAV